MKKDKKEVSIRIRMSVKDKELLEKNAKEQQISASQYIRMLIHNDKKEATL